MGQRGRRKVKQADGSEVVQRRGVPNTANERQSDGGTGHGFAQGPYSWRCRGCKDELRHGRCPCKVCGRAYPRTFGTIPQHRNPAGNASGTGSTPAAGRAASQAVDGRAAAAQKGKVKESDAYRKLLKRTERLERDLQQAKAERTDKDKGGDDMDDVAPEGSDVAVNNAKSTLDLCARQLADMAKHYGIQDEEEQALHEHLGSLLQHQREAKARYVECCEARRLALPLSVQVTRADRLVKDKERALEKAGAKIESLSAERDRVKELLDKCEKEAYDAVERRAVLTAELVAAQAKRDEVLDAERAERGVGGDTRTAAPRAAAAAADLPEDFVRAGRHTTAHAMAVIARAANCTMEQAEAIAFQAKNLNLDLSTYRPAPAAAAAPADASSTALVLVGASQPQVSQQQGSQQDGAGSALGRVAKAPGAQPPPAIRDALDRSRSPQASRARTGAAPTGEGGVPTPVA